MIRCAIIVMLAFLCVYQRAHLKEANDTLKLTSLGLETCTTFIQTEQLHRAAEKYTK